MGAKGSQKSASLRGGPAPAFPPSIEAYRLAVLELIAQQLLKHGPDHARAFETLGNLVAAIDIAKNVGEGPVPPSTLAANLRFSCCGYADTAMCSDCPHRASLRGGPAPERHQFHVNVPDSLNADSAKLVLDFANALAAKLARAEQKYGYTNGWLTQDWETECRQHMLDHIQKGDPLDVAAYCAFMWARRWSTTAPATTIPDDKAPLTREVTEPQGEPAPVTIEGQVWKRLNAGGGDLDQSIIDTICDRTLHFGSHLPVRKQAIALIRMLWAALNLTPLTREVTEVELHAAITNTLLEYCGTGQGVDDVLVDICTSQGQACARTVITLLRSKDWRAIGEGER